MGMTPRISKLHSFALRQLLHNAHIITVVPRPLRIADDWEERNIIFEDLKMIMNITVKEIVDKFKKLSTDWETLKADKSDWESDYPDPRFLGAWRKHRVTNGYMLRSELVYQLKKSMEQNPDFKIEQEYEHILIDEYQDLNKCDLEIIKKLAETGACVYACGDDDQSIYGFRFAYPQGIRMFEQEYSPCAVLLLQNCIRCGGNILQLALFVASLDISRIPKTLIPHNKEELGEVNLLNFSNEREEAACVAKICKYLIEVKDIIPKDILILTRNDRQGVFFKCIKRSFRNYRATCSNTR
jgi:DNA helicase-2/ATP-dependent DNA helicase PcrA